MAEWVYEAGIGEARAALIDSGRIVEAHIEPESSAPRPGSVVDARLRASRIAELDGGQEALLDQVPPSLPEGAAIRVRIVREALSEPGKPKRMKAKLVPRDAPLADGNTLFDRIVATGVPVRTRTAQDDDALEAAGWSECIEQAQSGDVTFKGGALHIALTPAMTLIDIDGQLPADELAVAGLAAAGQAIRRFGIVGNIGIDVPTLQNRAARLAAADAIAAVLEFPHERTAINGFGFMQVVRQRERASLLELLQYGRAETAARALLRRAQRSKLVGSVTLVCAPAAHAVLAGQADWLSALGRELGGDVGLRADPAIAMDGGYAEAR